MAIGRAGLISAMVVSMAVVLSGCDKGPDSSTRQEAAGAIAPAVRNATLAVPMSAKQGEKLLAVSHAYTLRLKPADLAPAFEKHMAECEKLGCQVLDSHLYHSGEDQISASATVRLAPEAFPRFNEVLSAPPAEIVSHSQTAEDKTVAILDVEKRLEAKLALRTRLEALLQENHHTSLGDLLAVEKELAEVQGDIESATAQRDYLRKQTDTVRVSIRYESVAPAPRISDFSPVVTAWKATGHILALSIARLIRFVTWALPWIPLGLLALWGVRRLFSTWRQKRQTPSGGA